MNTDFPRLGFLAIVAIALVVTCSNVRAFQVCWEAPTQNMDGTPLTDLLGYVIYFGTSSGNYTNTRTLFVDQPWPANDCTNVRTVPGTYYVRMTAFDVENNESPYSEHEARKIETRLGGPSGGELLGPSGGGLITEEN